MDLMALSLTVLLLLSVAVDQPKPAPVMKPVAAGKATTACAAVTRSDVVEALGRLVDLGESGAAALQSTCDYSGEGGQVSVTVAHVKQKLDACAELQALKTDFPDATIRELAGLGARAFFLDLPGAGTQLHVLRGEHDYLMVSVLGFGAAERVSAAAEKMARRALARM